MTSPTWGPPPQSAPQPSGLTRRQKRGLGCGGAVFGFLVIMWAIGTFVVPKKADSSDAAPVNVSVSAVPASDSATPSASRPAAPPTSAKPKPKASPQNLAHGPQTGLTNCIISFKDAQMGAGTSTFSAIVLDDSGKVYAPADSNPYSVIYEMTATGADGTSYAVSEALGNGSRTAADNNGSPWFTATQNGVQVSTNSTEGMVDSTVPVPLSKIKSVSGDIVITSQTDANYLKQATCAVRPA